MAAPSVYAAIHAIIAELAEAGIPKTRINQVEQYSYRSIDDVLNRLAPLLAKHRLCVLPRMLERDVTERTGANQELLIAVAVRAEFTFISIDDGSMHPVETYGEALDGGDKATAKAMSAAYKAAMIQTFCIPIPGSEDADTDFRRLSARTHVPEPVQGWQQWATDMADIVGVCESTQAIDLVQERNRELLKALSREQPDEYARVGEVFTGRRATLDRRASKRSASAETPKSRRVRKREQRTPESANA